MISFITEGIALPKGYQQNATPTVLFDSLHKICDFSAEPIIEKLLQEIEGSTINDNVTIKTRYGKDIPWNYLANSIKTVIIQYYICKLTVWKNIPIVDLTFCGTNTIKFMLDNEEYFNKVPMLLTYPLVEADYDNFREYTYKINGYVFDGIEGAYYIDHVNKIPGRKSCSALDFPSDWECYYEERSKEIKDYTLKYDVFRIKE